MRSLKNFTKTIKYHIKIILEKQIGILYVCLYKDYIIYNLVNNLIIYIETNECCDVYIYV